MRFGLGYDVHKLIDDRALILGGVEIDYHKGLDGHSDADVLLHAIMDAMLGAVGLRDIGFHFPDTDESYKGTSSMSLLKEVVEKVKSKGYKINNIDSVIVCQKPKLSSYIPQMVEKIAACLEIEAGYINIKATTTEGLGFEGKQEGIAAMAIVSVASI